MFNCKTENLATKGEVLRHFLEQANWKPERVILIDDDSLNLDYMAMTMQEWKVDYIGLHYMGGQNLADPIAAEEMHQIWIKLIKQLQAASFDE